MNVKLERGFLHPNIRSLTNFFKESDEFEDITPLRWEESTQPPVTCSDSSVSGTVSDDRSFLVGGQSFRQLLPSACSTPVW